jgi:hypothetical protein
MSRGFVNYVTWSAKLLWCLMEEVVAYLEVDYHVNSVSVYPVIRYILQKFFRLMLSAIPCLA